MLKANARPDEYGRIFKSIRDPLFLHPFIDAWGMARPGYRVHNIRRARERRPFASMASVKLV